MGLKVNGVLKVTSTTVPIPLPPCLISAGLIKSETIQVLKSRHGKNAFQLQNTEIQ
jgi:hypothetical protein